VVQILSMICIKDYTLCRFYYLCTAKANLFKFSSCPDGGTGRRVGLKNQWGNSRAGSIPAPGTVKKLSVIESFFYSLSIVLILTLLLVYSVS
jgi:hypothetical protein